MSDYPEAAWLGRFGSILPSQTTWLHKSLNGVGLVEARSLNSNLLINYYSTIMENNLASGSGKTMSGEWIETQAFIYWLSTAIQKNIFKLLINQPKIPATQKGGQLVVNALRQVLDLAISIDGISSYTVHDVEIQPQQHNIKIRFKAMLVNAISYVDGIEGELTT